jgi:hypothetical protein
MLPALTEQQRLMLEHPCTTIKGMKTPKSFGVGSTPMHNSHRYIVNNIVFPIILTDKN